MTWDGASLASLLLALVGAGVAGLASVLTYMHRRDSEAVHRRAAEALDAQERPGRGAFGRPPTEVLSADVVLRMHSGETLVVTLESPTAVQRLLDEGLLGPRADLEIEIAQRLSQARDDERWRVSLLASLVPAVMALTMVVILQSPQYLAFAVMSPLLISVQYASHRRRLRRTTGSR